MRTYCLLFLRITVLSPYNEFAWSKATKSRISPDDAWRLSSRHNAPTQSDAKYGADNPYNYKKSLLNCKRKEIFCYKKILCTRLY